MGEPRTKSGRVVKPSWRLQQNDSYAKPVDLIQPSPARSTSSLPGRSTISAAESRPPPLKRKRTSLSSSKPAASLPFNSSSELTPVVSATSSSTSILDVAQRPPSHRPAFPSSGKAPHARRVSAKKLAPSPPKSPLRPPPPDVKTVPTPPSGRGPIIRSFIDFNDGSEELGVVITSGDFAWDGEMDGGSWRATKNIRPELGLKYRVTMCVQKLPPGPGRSPVKGIRRLSSPKQSKPATSPHCVPSPQEILARLPPGRSKAQRRAPPSVSGIETDIGEGHTDDGIDDTDDDYDARIEQQASSSSLSSSSAFEEDPSDDADFRSEPEEDDEIPFRASRRKSKRCKAASSTATTKKPPINKRKSKATERMRSPSFFGHGSYAAPTDDGLPRDRFGMPFPLGDDSNDEGHDRHPPFSGGLNLGQFENPLSLDEQYPPEQYHEPPLENDVPPDYASDDRDERAMLELLAKIVHNGELAASALEAVEAATVPLAEQHPAPQQAEVVEPAPTPSEVVALVTVDGEPGEHEVLAAILAAEQLTAASVVQPPSSALGDTLSASAVADAALAIEEELLVMNSTDPPPQRSTLDDILTAVEFQPHETSIVVS